MAQSASDFLGGVDGATPNPSQSAAAFLSSPEPEIAQKSANSFLLDMAGDQGMGATPSGPSPSAWDYMKGVPQAAARLFNTTVVGGIVQPIAQMGESITTLGGMLPRRGPSVSEILQPYAEQPLTDLEKKTGVDVTAPLVNIAPYSKAVAETIVQKLGIDPNGNSGKAILGGTARVGDLVSGLTTPGNAALILTGMGLSKYAQAIAAAFVPGLAQGSAQGFGEAVHGAREGDAGKIAAGVVSGAGMGVFGVGAGRHALKPKDLLTRRPTLTESDRAMLAERSVQPQAPEVAPGSTISPQPAPTPAPPIKASEAAVKPSPLPTDRVAELQDLRSQIATAQEGKRIFKEQEGQGGTMDVSAAESTFPITGLGSKEAQLKVIDKVLSGKPLIVSEKTKAGKPRKGLSEAQIYDRMQEHLTKQREDYAYHQEQNPVPMQTADLNLKVGDEVKVPGDKLRVTKVSDEGITLKDGVTMTVDPVFDRIHVVGGEDGIIRAPDRATTIATQGDLAQKAGLNDSQMMALVGDTAKAENLRTLADRVSRGEITEDVAASEVRRMAGFEALPDIEAKNAELLRQQQAQDFAKYGRKEIPPQAPALEGATIGDNLFAQQRSLTDLVKDALGILGEKAGAVGKLTKEQIATRKRAAEARKEILRRASSLAEETGESLEAALQKIGLSAKQAALLTDKQGQYFMTPKGETKAGPFTRLREVVQDRMIRVKNLEKTSGVTKGPVSPYEAETLYHGRVGSRIAEVKDAATAIDKDIVATSKRLGGQDLTRDVNTYLQAKHAPERNAAHGDGAAGMTNEVAAREIERIKSSPAGKDIERIGKTVLDLNKKTLDVLLDGEVITKETYDTLQTQYPNHVPLQRILETTEDVGSFLASKGMDVKSTGLLRAKGSDLQVADILSNVSANLEAAIARAEKNRVDLSVLRFARDNPQLGLFEVSKPQATGLSFEGKPLFSKITDPQTLILREKGKPIHIKIKDPHLAAAYRGLNVENVPTTLRFVQKFTRFYSSLATRFNPEFFLPNKIRDLQEMSAFMASQPKIGFKGAGKAIMRDPASVKAVTEYVMGKDTEGARLYRQMIEDGGTTGGMGLSTREQVALDMERIRKINRSAPRKAANAVLEWIDKLNQVFEDSTRLSAYRQSLEQGMPREKAAIIAKESSINFNRKGTGGSLINALYMFSNASIQGSTKLLRAMRNPKVAAAVVGSVGAASFLVNQWNDEQDPDWRNKVSPYDRASSLPIVIPSSDGIRYVTIPISWGIKPIKVMSDMAYDAAAGKIDDPKEAASAAVGAIIEGYNPLGGTDILSALTPTIGDIPVEIGRNKAWYGNKIKPDYDPNAPASTQYFQSLTKTGVGRAAIASTDALSNAGIEISPADIVYAYNQIIGGTGKFLSKVATTAESALNGEVPMPRDVPFLSRFLKSKTDEEANASTLSKWKAKMRENKARARYDYLKAMESGNKTEAAKSLRDYKASGGTRINVPDKSKTPFESLTAKEKRLYRQSIGE